MSSDDALTTPTQIPVSNIHPLDSLVERLDLGALFPNRRPVEVELGSGDGSFFIAYARSHPGLNLVGVERLLGRLRKTDRKALRAGLGNVRLIRIEASYFLQWLLPFESIAALHVYFPDPWPKRKHRKHRLINDDFPALAARVLQASGTVRLRTDDLDYFEQMSRVMSGSPLFAPEETPAHLTALVTDFEAGFLAKGLPVYRGSYRKVSPDPSARGINAPALQARA